MPVPPNGLTGAPVWWDVLEGVLLIILGIVTIAIWLEHRCERKHYEEVIRRASTKLGIRDKRE